MSRVAIVGAGAVGTTIGALLARAGRHAITVCARAPIDGLELTGARGELRAEVHVVTRPTDAPEVDWVLLATKAHQTEGARAWLDALARPGVALAILQNGVEHEARVRPLAPRATLVAVVVSCPSDRRATGRARLRGDVRLVVRDDAAGAAFAELLEASGIEVERTSDLTTAAWTKLLANVVGGAMTALTNRPNGVFAREDVAAIARAMLLEAIAVGRAEGARLDDGLASAIVEGIARGDPTATPSILQDLRAGRALEHDARNGVIVRLGARHGIATPLNAMAATLLAALSEGNERRA